MREPEFHGTGRQPLDLPALILLVLALAAGLALPATAGQRLTDTDLPGGDYREFSLISPLPDFCEKVCAKDTRCKAWTFTWPGKRGKRAKCILKERVPTPKTDTCCISGIKGGADTSPAQTAEAPPAGSAGSADGDGRDAGQATGDEGATPAPQPVPDDNAAAEASEPPAQDSATEQDRQVAEATPPTGESDMTDAQRLALEEKRRFCEAYAEAAMRANALNRQLGCGYEGGRWGASYRGYYNWCMRNSKDRALANTRARERLLEQCRQQPRLVTPRDMPDAPLLRPDDDPFGGPPLPRGELESCRTYARLAAEQVNQARRLGCDMDGPAWAPGYDEQFEQCRQLTVAERRRLMRLRRLALKRCQQRRVRRPRSVEDWPPLPATPFRYQWVQVRGPGRWRSGWRPSVSGKCPLVRDCSCGPETCGVYPPGETTLMWPRGCEAPPVVIQCRVRRSR